MKILTYKRTHTGDPNNEGKFGIRKCMGKIRSYQYDAIIGIGGLKPWSENIFIRKKLTWIGFNPQKTIDQDNGSKW